MQVGGAIQIVVASRTHCGVDNAHLRQTLHEHRYGYRPAATARLGGDGTGGIDKLSRPLLGKHLGVGITRVYLHSRGSVVLRRPYKKDRESTRHAKHPIPAGQPGNKREEPSMEWTGAVYADGPTVEVSTWVAAPPQRVWEMASDIHVIAESSQELQRVEWTDGDGPRVGARFTGYNRHPALGEWSSVSEVVEFEPLAVFGWAVGDADNPAARWRLRLTPEGTGTRLTQWMQLGPAPSGLSLAIAAMPDKEAKIVFVRLREFEAAMAATVDHLKQRAEN